MGVAPKTLNNLADLAVNFDCENATCTSPADEAFIDDAVSRMGGYSEITATLQDVFRHAIMDAHKCLGQAVTKIQSSEEINVGQSSQEELNPREPRALSL